MTEERDPILEKGLAGVSERATLRCVNCGAPQPRDGNVPVCAWCFKWLRSYAHPIKGRMWRWWQRRRIPS